MCRDLDRYTLEDLSSGRAFSDSSFLLEYGENEYGFSWWVTPKRSRSYPRARVYDTYNHETRVTVIPLVKDEGKDGDRDYLQWDTISLMSLLQVYVIVGYYQKAERNPEYENKITNQQFDYEYIKDEFLELTKYQSDALHWNLHQVSKLDEVAERVETCYYEDIHEATGVKLHNKDWFDRRMEKITKKADKFKDLSRNLAREAQRREALTIQPKESVSGDKARVTIRNYLGGEYYFTADECMKKEDKVVLIEKKHSYGVFPSLNDIKNGIVRMMLFSNLDTVTIDENEYEVIPVLGITGKNFPGYTSNSAKILDNIGEISDTHKEKIEAIFQEANTNNFTVIVTNSKKQDLEENLINKITT